MSRDREQRKLPRSGTIRRRALLASLMLLILMGSIVLLAIVRAQGDRRQHAAIEQRAATLSELQESRAQFYLADFLITSAGVALPDDPTAYVDSYRQAIDKAETSLEAARIGLIAEDDPNILALLNDADKQREQLLPALNSLIQAGAPADQATRMTLSKEAAAALWPTASALIGDLAGLASAEQDKLAAQAAEANREATNSLWLMVGLGTIGLLTALAVLVSFVGSVLRPLASLQRSVQAVMSGNPRSRASVSGPQEVASLAHDFNRMIGQQEHTAEEMAHRLEIETAVAQTSNLLVAA